MRLAESRHELPASVTITDALGRVVYQAHWLPSPSGAGPGEGILDLSKYPPGLYALRLQWPDVRAVTRRLVR